MDEVYYVKKGRRYHPARQEVVYDSFPEGSYLMVVKPGVKSIIRIVEPAHAELLAASHDVREAMMNALIKAAEFTGKPSGRETTDKEKEAWKAYCDVLGKAPIPVYMEGVSIRDIVQAGVDVLVRAAAQKEGAGC